MKFKDAQLQAKHGKTLAKLFAKHMGKINVLDDLPQHPDDIEQMSEEELEELLYNGEGIYWTLKRDKHVNIIGVKPYEKDTVLRNLRNLHKRAEARQFQDIFSGVNPMENLR